MLIIHAITIFRLFAGPFFLLLYLTLPLLGFKVATQAALLLLLLTICEISDLLDGFLARLLNNVTELGKILDPMADSICRLSIFLAFTKPPINLPIFVVFVFFYRDTIISCLRTVCALRGYALAARPSGKLKAFVLASTSYCILFAMLAWAWELISEETMQQSCLYIAACSAVYSFLSGIDYLYANKHHIERLLYFPSNRFKLPRKVGLHQYYGE